MRLVVTGGSGFLGRRLVARAVADGHHVVGLARSAAAATTLERLGAEPVDGDLDDPASLPPALRAAKADALLNLASLGFGHAPAIVAAAEAAGPRRAVFVSTTAIFTTLDAASRAVRVDAERTVTGSRLDWTLVRPTMIYGAPGDRNLERLIRLVHRTPLLPVPGGGRRFQQPVHVDDLAGAILTAAQRARAVGATYDLAGPEPLTLRRIIGDTAAATGRRVVCLPVPLGPVLAAARGYERRTRRPAVRAEQLARLAEDKTFSIEPARADLSYAPRPFAAGIRDEASRIR